MGKNRRGKFRFRLLPEISERRRGRRTYGVYGAQRALPRRSIESSKSFRTVLSYTQTTSGVWRRGCIV